jgi:ArsR family transcriptional regulator
MLELDRRLRVLAHPTRARAVAFLADPVQSCCSRDDGVCACDLEAFLEVGQSTVSHHMKALVDAGLVHAEKRGRWVYYELDAGALRELAANLSALAAIAEARDPTDVEPGLLRERGRAAGVGESP